MFAVEVSDQIMIAHSFRGEVFGPAQELHGATFVVRAAFLSEQLDPNGIVVDIGCAHEVLKAALAPLNYAISTTLPQFKGINTTTEFLTKLCVRSARRCGARRRARPRRRASSRRSASRSRNRRPRAPGTRRRCGEGGRRSRCRAISRRRPAAMPMTGASSRSCAALGWQVEVLESARAFRVRRRTCAPGAGAQLRGAAGRAADRDRRAGVRRAAGGGRRRCSDATPLVALVHHPLALETGLSADAKPRRCARANARRWPAPAHVDRHQRRRPRGCSSPTTACRPSA